MAAAPISLFTVPAKSQHRPLSLLLSLLLHGAMAAFLIFVLLPAPSIRDPYLPEKYSVRMLLIHTPQPAMPRSKDSISTNSYPSDVIHKASLNDSPPDFKTRHSSVPADLRMLLQLNNSPSVELPQDLPIPAVLLVSAVNLPNQKVIAPPAQVQAAADVKPVFQLPNHEHNLADVAVTSTVLSANDSTVQASTTSPLRLQGAKLEQKVPQTPSDATPTPASATIMALSDVQMREGTVAIPMTVQKSSSARGPEDEGSTARSNTLSDNKNGSSTGLTGPGGPSQTISIKRVTLPKDGRFSMVLVGNSLDEQYPEIAGIWGGRLAYPVYLQVWLARNWILQYARPQDDQSDSMGTSSRLDAPWPTEIFVPNFPAGYTNSDALIVHGMLNKNGHFDQLKVVFPPQFPETRFVLELLQRWIFRPASQNGQSADVDVLLIIPDQED